MKIGEWLTHSTAQLAPTSATARLDAELILADALHQERAWILAHPEHLLDESMLNKARRHLERRVNHEPIAYIRQKTEFYGREFKVNKHTLEPRPESETMIELFKALPLPDNALVGDIGCGSGALGVTAALERPTIRVHFIDIDPDTLGIARHNARKHNVKAQYYCGDLLEAWPDSYDILLCNLPYVPDTHTINEAALFEPRIAIFGGPDGLDVYRKLFSQLASKRYGRPTVLTESLPFQHQALASIAAEHGYTLQTADDFIQVFSSSAPLPE